MSCSICLDNFNKPYILNCMHSFCFECIDTCLIHWLAQPGTELAQCPLCKQPIEWFLPNFQLENTIEELTHLQDENHQLKERIKHLQEENEKLKISVDFKTQLSIGRNIQLSRAKNQTAKVVRRNKYLLRALNIFRRRYFQLHWTNTLKLGLAVFLHSLFDINSVKIVKCLSKIFMRINKELFNTNK